ncbi:unnamed protein product [Rotaria sordida]|uniref:K Homology domain-containing protein n=2 Tax=Rotaria sordida TaxID=392033 RepID=A0A813PV65_9BILA|nr:unnamed protein product [Rotaria sordida]
MSNNNGLNPLPLFNNNKSLYGTRTQTNQSSKKISIIEDKTTLEPARPTPSSPIISSTNLNTNNQRSTSISISTSSELSPSQIRKKIQIQKQALNSFDLKQMHEHVYQELDEWKNSMYNRIRSMKDRMLKENTDSYEELMKLQNLMKEILEDKLIKQLSVMKNNPQLINSEELDEIEQNLKQIKDEIDYMRKFDSQLDSSNVQINGELQLNKTTDFSKHQPLPHPPPSPPPPQSLASIPDIISKSPSPSPVEYKPIPPVWTDATRQGLNNLSHYLPFRLLIPNYVREELIKSLDIEQFNDVLKLSCQSTIECILTIIDQNDLDGSIDILTDLMVAFKCSSNQYEIRLLFQKKFISIITGKRNERLERLRDKYQLDMVKVFPQTCPQSDERVVLLRCQHSEYIIYCIREIIQNVLEQAHFTDEDSNQSYLMYDPSINYDESCAHEYGAYKPNDTYEIISNKNIAASFEDLTEPKQRSIISINSSSSSSLSKNRYNYEDAPLNYDDTEPESDDNDDDDDFQRSKSSDDKRIFVKELNYVKGRQVGLLIGPFGQHITQIREQTGAKIHLTNDDNEPSVIKGTKCQIKQALRLIKECLQTQKPIPRTAYKGGRRR